jgi:hypothetical protein
MPAVVIGAMCATAGGAALAGGSAGGPGASRPAVVVDRSVLRGLPRVQEPLARPVLTSPAARGAAAGPVPRSASARVERRREPAVIVDGSALEAVPRTSRPGTLTAASAAAASAGAVAPGKGGEGRQDALPGDGSGRPWAVTLFGGVSIDEVAFSETVLQPWNGTWGSDTFLGVAGSYQAARFWHWFTVEPELGLGTRLGDTGSVEAWGALYVRFDGFPWNQWLYTTVAGSVGLNWISSLPVAEAGTPAAPEADTSKVLHYFSPELTFALPQHRQYEFVVRYHHRSGFFGAINGVEDGSNVIAFGLRYRLPVR